jgi:hypothetical protein
MTYGWAEQTYRQSSEAGVCLNAPALDADGLFSGPAATFFDGELTKVVRD